jgi:drug/metabolite transporter (DMT)-like permease
VVKTSNAVAIRMALRNGEVMEIGEVSRQRARSSRIEIAVGFAAIYLIWGSTYLGIRYAVETIPPLLMMGIRHTTAGILVYAWARTRGAAAPHLKQWGYAATAGLFLFVAGHGVLAWAEQRIPSGLAALLCATLPLWTVLVARLKGAEQRLSGRAWAGLILGFAGVGVLIGPGALRAHGALSMLGIVAAISSSLAWAVGTIYSKSVHMSSSTVLSAAMQMVAGGVSLLVAAFVSGETAHVAPFSLRSLLALAYLIVFGSIIAFTVFTWLLTVASPSRVSTYAYVNPVVAVFLGWMVAGEAVGWNTWVATLIITAGVALVNTRSGLSRNEGH